LRFLFSSPGVLRLGMPMGTVQEVVSVLEEDWQPAEPLLSENVGRVRPVKWLMFAGAGTRLALLAGMACFK